MPALGQKQTLDWRPLMSALPPKADIDEGDSSMSALCHKRTWADFNTAKISIMGGGSLRIRQPPGLACFEFRPHSARMAKDRSETFECPNCHARYDVVRITPGAETRETEIFCRICEQPLRSRDGDSVLKYFLTSRSKAARRARAPQTP
jgi:hypothetical protein